LQLKKYFEPWISKGQGKLLTKNKSRYINKQTDKQIQAMFLELTLAGH
jgi:hypothetical protein